VSLQAGMRPGVSSRLISVVIVAVQMRGKARRRRVLDGLNAECKHKVAYHDILDKGNARDGALYARKDIG
jgi:hypothetical protein